MPFCYTLLMTTGKIFLSGGGDEHASELLDKQFFKEILLNGKILYIATGFREDERFLHASEWMQGVIKLHGRSDIIFQMDNDLTQIKHLADYDAVYIGGGDVDILMDEFDRTGFEFVIKAYSEHGGTVYGGGGGAIVLGKYIDTNREIRRQYKTGIDLLDKYSVCTSYKDENMDGWVQGHGSHLICIPEGIGVVIKDGKIISDAGKSYTIYEH